MRRVGFSYCARELAGRARHSSPAPASFRLEVEDQLLTGFAGRKMWLLRFGDMPGPQRCQALTGPIKRASSDVRLIFNSLEEASSLRSSGVNIPDCILKVGLRIYCGKVTSSSRRAYDVVSRDNRHDRPSPESAVGRSLAEQPLPGDDERWDELLSDLDVDDLTATLMSRAIASGSHSSPIADVDLRQAARLSFQTLIDNLRTDGCSSSAPMPTDSETPLARPGPLLAADRLAGGHYLTVLWEGLVGAAKHDDAELLIRHTSEVFSTVVAYTLEISATAH